jgi:hypothetical protein
MNPHPAPTPEPTSALAPPDAHLTMLEQQYETLCHQLADLDLRRRDVQTQIQRLESALASLRASPPAGVASGKAPVGGLPVADKVEAIPSLRDLIDAMVREAGGSELSSSLWRKAALRTRSVPPLGTWLGHLASSSRLCWVSAALGLVALVLLVLWVIS